MPYPRACLGLLLVGCPADGNEDGSSTGSTSLTSSSGGTQPSDTDNPQTTTGTTEATDSGCPDGQLGCPCMPGDMCLGGLECNVGTCQEPGRNDTTDGDETSTGGEPAMCNNGVAEAGDLCLGVVTPYSMGLGTIDVAVGDFDADPALDVVAANRDDNTVSIRLGDGTGGLGTETSFPAGMGPIAIGVGDFNADGELDAVTANLTSIDVTVLSGTGTGDFGPSQPTGLGALLVPTDLEVADLDNDMDPDVVVAENSLSALHVLRTDVGAFMPAVTYPVGMGPVGVDLADFSGDGVLDLVAVNATAGSVSLLLGNGFGQFGDAASETAGAGPVDVSTGDFNGDGMTDAIVANPGGNVTVRLGNGLGDWGGQLPFPVAGGPSAIFATDLDLDGDTDVVVAGADSMVHILLGNGAGTLEAGPDIAVGLSPNAVIAADLNEDGLPDLITANTGAGSVSVILSNA